MERDQSSQREAQHNYKKSRQSEANRPVEMSALPTLEGEFLNEIRRVRYLFTVESLEYSGRDGRVEDQEK